MMRTSRFHFALCGSAAASFLLAACAPESADPVAETDPSNAGDTTEAAPEKPREAMAETAWLSVTPDGGVHITYLDDDGRYRDTRGGETVFSGSWEHNNSGELCFTPDSGEAACWEHGSTNSEGILRATDEEGRAIELRRVSYAPAPATTDSAENADENVAGR